LSSVEEGRILVTDSLPSVRYEPENTLRWEEEYNSVINFWKKGESYV
jgi:hypothetical protein